MKTYFEGYKWGSELCIDVEKGNASLKRVRAVVKKKLSEYEKGQITACEDWLERQNSLEQYRD